MPFQTRMNVNPPVGVEGGFASENPRKTLPASNGAFVADPVNGATLGRFCWADSTMSFVSNFAQSGIPVAPSGLLAAEMQARVIQPEAESSMVVLPGAILEVFTDADIWMRDNVVAATPGQKAFANLFDGSMLAANTGSFPTYPAGTGAVGKATFATNVMTVTTATFGVLGIGDLVTGSGLPFNTRVAGFGSYNLGTGLGTVVLTTTPGTITPAINFTSVPAEEFGGATGTATFATDVMTVVSTTAGSFYAGQLIQSSGVTAGTYIVAQLSPTTFQLSTTPGTITLAQAVTASAWIETAFSVESLAGEGELVKVGRSL
jgi:hypothetical protein